MFLPHDPAHRVERVEEDAQGKEDTEQKDQDIGKDDSNEKHRPRIPGHQKQEQDRQHRRLSRQSMFRVAAFPLPTKIWSQTQSSLLVLFPR